MRKSKTEFTIWATDTGQTRQPRQTQKATTMSHISVCHTEIAVIGLAAICGTLPSHLTLPHSCVCNTAPTQPLYASVSFDRWKE